MLFKQNLNRISNVLDKRSQPEYRQSFKEAPLELNRCIKYSSYFDCLFIFLNNWPM